MSASQDPHPIDDMLIIGGGISGINAACRLTDTHPHLTYTLLEARSTLGGTWDLFKYPGIRSDSDLHTFGYAFRAWRGPAIASAPEILAYLHAVADEYNIPQHTRFDTKVVRASWSSSEQHWTVQTKHAITGETHEHRARFLFNCCGYYDYDQPLHASIPGIGDFAGPVVHPQFWTLTQPQYASKRVAIVGSGATAITLLPALAPHTAHVTLIQRSPSYIVATNPVDPVANALQSLLPETWASFVVRQKNVLRIYGLYHFARAFPGMFRGLITSMVHKQLPEHVPVQPHFTSRYQPWDQRIGLSPNGDFFQAFRERRASIATGNIVSVQKDHIALDTGDTITADIIVTATGLKLQFGGGIELVVDGERVATSEKFVWRGCMLEGVPNFAFAMGYTNASWTLGSDCTAHFVMRMLGHLAKTRQQVVKPEVKQREQLVEASLLDMSSTYVEKAKAYLPKTATTGPWKRRTNYWRDMWAAKHGSFDQLVFA
ncbi:related to monooxygenase [Sporisorium reilianum f. sp. reilianum]|uniref:Related to monooxygenase n=1 Tax=Sporisorium reilianum f. sp. reilianum TaxID=72559 RepID=A0A2N8UHN5_9BASI|nr:related to monooxygenase [Sporisorium reilianum f. sp. reilianum]